EVTVDQAYERIIKCGFEFELFCLAYDHCTRDICSSVFTIEAPEPVDVTCPDPVKVPACSSDEEIARYFYAWIDGFKVAGGCDPASKYWIGHPDNGGVEITVDEAYQRLLKCGFEIELFCFAYDHCTRDICSSVFTIEAPEPVDVTCPDPVKVPACSSDEEIARYFYAWIDGFKVAGGCDPVSKYWIGHPDNGGVEITVDEAYQRLLKCGFEIELFCLAYDHCTRDICSSVFAIEAPEPVDITCPDPVKVPACSSDEEIARYFYAWIDGFKVTGGCDPVSKYWIGHPENGGVEVSVDQAYERLIKCGFEFELFCVAYDHCSRDWCSSIFAIERPDPVDVTCPDPLNIPACATPEEIWKYIYDWAKGFDVQGGCPETLRKAYFAYIDNQEIPLSTDEEIANLSLICRGGSIKIKCWTGDHCTEDHCETYINFFAPDPVVVKCPDPVEVGQCMDPDALKAKFLEWCEAFTVEGGCNPTSYYLVNGERVEDLDKLKVPNRCGDKVEIICVAEDHCSADRCGSTFAVPRPEELVTYCPPPLRIDACTSDEQIKIKIEEWRKGFWTSGGCEAETKYYVRIGDNVEYTETSNGGLYDYLRLCGVDIYIRCVAKDACDQESMCNTSIHIGEPEPVNVSCPDKLFFGPCEDQEYIDRQFKLWLTGFTHSGGCGAVVTYEVDGQPVDGLGNLSVPEVCIGDSITVKCKITDLCGQEDHCTSSFCVERPQKLEVICPPDVTTDPCVDEEALESLFERWCDFFDIKYGCRPETYYLVNGEQVKEIKDLPLPSLCGDTIKVICIAKDLCTEASCTSTFIVPDPDPIKITCPADVVLDPCPTEDEVAEALNAWIKGFSAEGGCGLQAPFPLLKFPELCGDTIELFYFAWDKCDQMESCTSRFIIKDAPELKVYCPEKTVVGPCLSQDEVNEAFGEWVAGFKVEGGCGTVAPFPQFLQPDICGDTIEFTYIAEDLCDQRASCSSVFIVLDAPELVLDVPDDLEVESCLTADEIKKLKDDWLDAFSFTGGCNGTDGFSLVDPDPNDCEGGIQRFNYTVYSDCDTQMVTRNFIVPKHDPIVIKCPLSVKLAPCTEQDEIDEVFAGWIAVFGFDGGCGPDATDLSDLVAPAKCIGGTVDVIYIVKDVCEEQSCTSSFYVAPPDPLVIDYPEDKVVPACTSFEEMLKMYGDWIGEFTADGGCNTVVQDAIPLPPDTCGGSVEFYYFAQDDCNQFKEITKTFSIEFAPEVEVTCPPDQLEDADQTQDVVDAAFQVWKDQFMGSGGCNTKLIYKVEGEVVNPDTVSAPDACGGEKSMQLIAYSSCGADTCDSKFTVTATASGLILALPGQLHDCFAGPSEPSMEDVPPPRSEEEIIEVFLFVSACVETPEINVTSELFGPFIEGDEYKFIRVYNVVAGPLATSAEEIFVFEFDQTPPIFSNFPADVTIPCEGELPAWPLVRAFDEGVELPVTRLQVPGFASCGGAFYERRFTAVDLCGNMVTRKQTIRLSDDEPPVLTVPKDTTIKCGELIPGPYYEAADNCSTWEVVFEEAKDVINDCEYTLTRTWTARDGCGNKTTETQKIYIIDEEAPVIDIINPMLADIPNGGVMESFNCDNPQVAMSDILVSDCCPNVTVDAFDELVASNTCEIFGFYRKWKCGYTAVDGAGNIAEYYFYVHQYDTTGADFKNVPEDIELACEDPIPAPATDVEVKDDCSVGGEPNFSETILINPDNVQEVGIIRTWWYVDNCGNRSEATQFISRCGFDFSLASAQIGNSVWNDTNQDGMQDSTEIGLNGIQVNLYHVDTAREVHEIMIDSTVTSTIYGVKGQFMFDYLLPNTYRLEFEVPDSLALTLYKQGENDTLDSDVDPQTGMTNMLVVDTGQLYHHVDAGFIKVAPLTGLSLFLGNSVDCQNALSWQTSFEAGTKMFELQRADDEGVFITIGEIEPQGGMDYEMNYSFIDEKPYSTSRYRLMIVDLTGGVLYSDVVSLDLLCGKKKTDFVVFPNPTSNRVMVDFVLDQEGVVEFTITDRLGRKIHTEEGEYGSGKNQRMINLSNLPNGIYMIGIGSDGQMQRKAIVK
ncbi:MAG: T9SS type A sorting domain-containing protein, partial [Saprospiraceae bacterium]|nr:T9SS type A sorting domain-containing protein [Saprospiraceae bacterium]